MTMFLNIKLLFFLFIGFITLQSTAQVLKGGSFNDQSHKTVAFSLGTFQTNALGDSFIAENSSQKLGYDLTSHLYLIDKLKVGIRFNWFRLELDGDQPLYDRSTAFAFAFTAGYNVVTINDLTIALLGGAGGTHYRNVKGTERFSDTGSVYWLGAEIEYPITRYFQLYAGPEFRFDRLNIDAANAIDKEVNDINYLNLNFGLRITLWNDEGNESDDTID